MEWIFDGIGTQIVIVVISFILVGMGTSMIIRKKKKKAIKQKAGNYSNQIQINGDANVNFYMRKKTQ